MNYSNKKNKRMISLGFTILIAVICFITGCTITYALYNEPFHYPLSSILKNYNRYKKTEKVSGQVVIYGLNGDNTILSLTDTEEWDEICQFLESVSSSSSFEYSDFSFHKNRVWHVWSDGEIGLADPDMQYIYTRLSDDFIIFPWLINKLHKEIDIKVVANDADSPLEIIIFKEDYLWTNQSGNETVYVFRDDNKKALLDILYQYYE